MNLKLEVRADNWEKVARALGDDNPIHYCEHNKNPVCPGIYLFSDAEKRYRESFGFNPPMQIKGKFHSPAFQETLDIDIERNDKNCFKLIYSKDSGPVADFEFNSLFDKNYFSITNDSYQEVSSIDSEKLEMFNEGMQLNGNSNIYASFVLGGVLKSFLRERKGSVLYNMEFDFYKRLGLEEINTVLEIESKDVTKNPKRKVRRMEYCIKGQVNQGNRKIAIGRGLAFGKERIQSL